MNSRKVNPVGTGLTNPDAKSSMRTNNLNLAGGAP